MILINDEGTITNIYRQTVSWDYTSTMNETSNTKTATTDRLDRGVGSLEANKVYVGNLERTISEDDVGCPEEP